MGQIHPGFIADMLKHCERGERPPLTVWEAQQLLTLAQRALAAPPQGASSGWKLVPAWKLRRAAEILDRDGDEYGIAADLRSMLAAPPAPQEPAAGWKLLKDSTFEERSWQEDAGHENGNYMCGCHHCLRTFLGHKRRVTCKVCASPAPGELGAVEVVHLDLCSSQDDTMANYPRCDCGAEDARRFEKEQIMGGIL